MGVIALYNSLKDGGHRVPPSMECLKIFVAPQSAIGGPDQIGMESRPERYCQAVKPFKRVKSARPYLLDGDDLKSETSDSARKYVKMNLVAGTQFPVVVPDLIVGPTATTRKVRTKPHGNGRGNIQVPPKGVTQTTRKEVLSLASGMVKDNGGLKGKDRNRSGV